MEFLYTSIGERPCSAVPAMWWRCFQDRRFWRVDLAAYLQGEGGCMSWEAWRPELLDAVTDDFGNLRRVERAA